MERWLPLDALRRLSNETFPDGDDAAIRDCALFCDGVGIVIPPCRLELGYDKFSAGVGFGQHGMNHNNSGERKIDGFLRTPPNW